MDDLQKYINERMERDPEFADGYYEGYESFKVGRCCRITSARISRRNARRDGAASSARAVTLLLKPKTNLTWFKAEVLRQADTQKREGDNISNFVS